MDILLNPNIVYGLIVLGLMLAILAMITPGTGLLELGALFVLILAGWGVYNNERPINLWALVVLVVGVFPFFLAMRKSREIGYMAIAIVAFELGSVYLFQSDQWWKPAVNPFLALAVVVLTSGYLWLATRKVIEIEKTRPLHDLSVLVGLTGEAKTEIQATGTVQVNGELWSAWSDQPISMGASVLVLQREGFTLKVEPI
jgi:membrane-bound serine protease (ClpP class)